MPKFDTSADRRQSPRTKLVEIAYIGMGPENGGLVLDVSDGGLSFHAVAPVQQSETVRFLLSLRGHSRIEGAGEVVWTNEMRTVCGLRFTSLSSGAREHLNNWTNQSKPAAVAVEEPEETEEPETVASSSSSTTLSPEAAPVQEIAEPEQVKEFVEDREAPVAASVAAAFPASAAPLAIARTTPRYAEPPFSASPTREFYLSAPLESASFWQTPILSWLAVGLLTASLTAAGYFYGVRVGQSQRTNGMPAQPATQVGPSTLEAAPAPAGLSAADASPGAAAPAPAASSDTPATQEAPSVSKVALSG